LLSILVNSLQRIVEIVFVKIHHFFDGTILAQKHYRQLLDYKKTEPLPVIIDFCAVLKMLIFMKKNTKT
jgi:hypothetical protein